MKRNNIYLFFLLTFICSSCNLLDLAPIDYYASGNYWKNESQVNSYMNGIHSEFRDKYNLLYQLGEERGGTQRTSIASQSNALDDSNPIKMNNFTAASTGISNWGGLYNNIMKINSFIVNVEGGCDFLSAEDRGNYLGQAYGIRTFYYFLLYRTFGGLPLLMNDDVLKGATAEEFYTPRSTARETMNQIKSDIKKSIDYFDGRNGKNPAFWTLGASLSLKSEIYLWSGKVTLEDQMPATGNADLIEAKTTLDEILGMGYELENKFEDVFSSNNKGGKEIIFTFRFKEGEKENNIKTLYQISEMSRAFHVDGTKFEKPDILDMGAKTERQQRHEYLFEFWETFENEDTRRDYTFLAYHMGVGKEDDPNTLDPQKKTDSGTMMKKYMGIINESKTRIYESDIPVYRYSNILLMRAEVANALGEDPTSYLNRVRRRAYEQDINAVSKYDIQNKAFAENELAILQERDKEFVWEGTRWFDLCRMHDANHEPLVFASEASYIMNGSQKTPVLDKAKDKHMLLWPIDTETLNANPNLDPNPGY